MEFNPNISTPIPSIIEQVEEAIIQQLDQLKEFGIAVMGFPNDHREIGKPYPNGLVLVAYDGSDFKAPEVTDIVRQESYQSWVLSIGLKNLRNNRGAFSVMKAISLLLTGFKPPHCGPLFAIKEQFVRIDAKSKVWEYAIEFKCRCYNVQTYIDDAIALLKSVTFEINADATANQNLGYLLKGDNQSEQISNAINSYLSNQTFNQNSNTNIDPNPSNISVESIHSISGTFYQLNQNDPNMTLSVNFPPNPK